MNPELSIIIPCYNYGHYLRESVDSVLQQDYTNYELILVDDGSTDATWTIMEDYASRFPQVRLFKHSTNQGIFKATQTGWDAAQGTHLHFFSADDRYHPFFLSRAMQIFHDHPHLGLVCSDLSYFRNDTGETVTPQALPRCKYPRVFSPTETSLLLKMTNFWIPGVTCIVKQDTLKQHGYVDPKLENISDWFCFHKIALFEGVGYIPDKLISMRLHDQTYTSRVKRDKKRRRTTYWYLLELLQQYPETRSLFQKSGLLTFIFKELYWKLRFNPRYLRYWHHLKKP
jgi:glycosyltransferase involved in cell wall biosynthesis